MLLSETIRDLARDRPRRSAVLLASLTLLAVAALTSTSSSSKAASAPSPASSSGPSLLAASPSRPAAAKACTKSTTARSITTNKSMGLLGGPTAGDPEESRRAAEFAVAQLQTNSAVAKTGALSLARIVSAQRQVVAGTNHILVLETKDAAGTLKTVRATVWEKLPDHSRNGAPRDLELTRFSVADGGAPAAEGVECGGGNGSGAASSSWQDAAARAAVEGINARSNSLVPYELAAVLDAKRGAAGADSPAELRLRLKRGDKSETFRVSVKEKAAASGGAAVGAAKGGGGSSFGLVSFAHEP